MKETAMDMAPLDQKTYQLAIAFQAALRGPDAREPEHFHEMGLRLCEQLIARYQGTERTPVQTSTPPRPEYAPLAPWQARKAMQILSTVRQDKLLIAEVAAQCAMSRSHFSRAFKKATGLSPQAWSLKSRIEQAQRLLAGGKVRMCQIALECGFADQAHFSRTFSRVTGTTPRRWQLNQRANLAVA